MLSLFMDFGKKLPALFSCISPHTTWETENTMEFVVM